MCHFLPAGVIVAVLFASVKLPKPPAKSELATTKAAAQPTAETRVEMVNDVHVRLDPKLTVRIRRLSGKFLPTKKEPPTFDDKRSYVIEIDAAEIAVSMAGMSHAMNTYVFGDSDAPLKNLQLSPEGEQVKQKGTLKKGIGIPFETVGTLSPTPDGKIRIHPTKMKAAHLPVKGLMKLFRLDMEKLINTRKTRGISVDDNDIILDPSQMLPPPQMRGRITAVRVQGNDIVQIFGNQKPTPPDEPRSNYMAYRGGVLRFGRLTMTDVDMRLIDADPADAFDFFPDHYNEHLVAGYSKTTASGGLRVYMPDYNKIKKTAVASKKTAVAAR